MSIHNSFYWLIWVEWKAFSSDFHLSREIIKKCSNNVRLELSYLCYLFDNNLYKTLNKFSENNWRDANWCADESSMVSFFALKNEALYTKKLNAICCCNFFLNWRCNDVWLNMAKNNRKKHTHTIQNRHYITHTSHHQFSQTKNKWECVQRCNVHAVWIRACFIYECLHFFLRLSVCWQSHTMHMYTSNSYELYFWQKKSSVWFWTLTMGRENKKKTLNWTFKWFSVKLLITYSVHICCE